MKKLVLDNMATAGFNIIDNFNDFTVLEKSPDTDAGTPKQLCLVAYGANLGCSAGTIVNADANKNQKFDAVLMQNGFKKVADIKKSPYHQYDLQVFAR